MVLCLLFGVPYIDFLKKKTIGQYILEVAPETHAQKAGTPTTGGVFIILAVIISSVITLLMAEKIDNTAWIILITLFFMALAGFQDDYLKLKGCQNKGLSPKGKLVRQFLIALIPTLYSHSIAPSSPRAPELGILTIIAPNPIGRSKEGSRFFLIARKIKTAPTMYIIMRFPHDSHISIKETNILLQSILCNTSFVGVKRSCKSKGLL